MNLDDYKHMWRDRNSGRALFRVGDSEYSIVNMREDSILIIEDDELADAIEQEMLRHDMPIVGPEDFKAEDPE